MLPLISSARHTQPNDTQQSKPRRNGLTITCLCRKRAARLPSLAEGKETGTNRRGGDVRFDLEMSRELWDQQENPTRLLRFERNPDDAPTCNRVPHIFILRCGITDPGATNSSQHITKSGKSRTRHPLRSDPDLNDPAFSQTLFSWPALS